MKKVKMLAEAKTNDGLPLHKGKAYELEQPLADRLIGVGAAELVPDESKRAVVVPEPAVEVKTRTR